MKYRVPELLLLSPDEQSRRLVKVRSAMEGLGITNALLSSNTSLYYLTGRVYAGYLLLTPDSVTYYIKRPVELEGDNIVYIRKPEDIKVDIGPVALELSEITYAWAKRLAAIFGEENVSDVSPALSMARAVKTPVEIKMLRLSGSHQDAVYRRIPKMYSPGMTDIELQIEIERESRLEGCLGQFRISGDSMELFMGNVLAGDNADAPSPYDFAMGGAGMDPSIPVGADGTVITHGMSVMIDVNGNYTGYMTDMTRVFRAGDISDLAWKAQQCSVDIHRMVQSHGVPGAKASDLYNMALEMVRSRDLEAYFMGHRQHAGFIGHGVGIEINELPVIAPRSRDVLQLDNVVALEPKFVIPGTGAVGIENTYIVTPDGMECITNCTEEVIDLF